jgi:hypothetical protein
MTITDFSPAGADYWFLAPDAVDRLTDDECPLDDVEQARQIAMLDAEIADAHQRKCAHSMGPHLPSECPR